MQLHITHGCRLNQVAADISLSNGVIETHDGDDNYNINHCNAPLDRICPLWLRMLFVMSYAFALSFNFDMLHERFETYSSRFAIVCSSQ